MPSLEDKRSNPEEDKRYDAENALRIQDFEKMLRALLQRCLQYQKEISQLIEENNALKCLIANNNPVTNRNKNVYNLLQGKERKQFIQKINAYIKDIDDCLGYFEKT